MNQVALVLSPSRCRLCLFGYILELLPLIPGRIALILKLHVFEIARIFTGGSLEHLLAGSSFIA